MPIQTPKPAVDKARKKQPWKKSAKKWTRSVVDAGMTIIPYTLLVKQAELKITPTEMNILLQIISAWWTYDKLPFLKKTTIGKRINLAARNVQKHLKSLETKGFLNIKPRYGPHNGRLSNEYDLRPLALKLQLLAEKMKADSDAKKGGAA
jgi:predicted transcriptional regulator